MNAHLPQSVKATAQKLATEAQEFAHREPSHATAVAVGVALGWHLIPTRLIFRTLVAAASGLAKPALLALGAMKAFELYRSSHEVQQHDVAGVSSTKHPRESALVIIP